MAGTVSTGPRVSVALAVLLLASVVGAGPAAAIEDATRPTGSVTYGPNCTDGFLRVAISNGTEAHTLTLSYDGVASGPPTDVAAGAQTTLEGAEVDWGQTVDVTVTVSGPAGAEDPLTFRPYTRPTEAECAEVAPPTGTDPTTPAPLPPTTTPAPTTAPAPTTTTPPTSSTPQTTPPRSTPPSSPAPTSTTSVPAPTTPVPTTQVPDVPYTSGPLGSTVSSERVSPGSVVTVRGTGFSPGEQVSVSLDGVDAPLTTVTADESGRVEAIVQIPQDVVLGPASVQLVGQDSAASTAVDLQVAAIETPDEGRTPWPLLAGGLALLLVAVGLAAAAARRPRPDDWAPPGAGG